MSSNSVTVSDNHEEFDDWLEIANTSDAPIDLAAFTIEDNQSGPFAFADGVVVGAGGFLVVFCDDALDQATIDEPHVPFKLSKDGDFVTLRSAATTDVVDSIELPALGANVSYGRFPDGDDAFRTMRPTPGAANVDEPAGEGEGEGEGEGGPCFDVAPPVFVNEALVDNVTGLLDDADDHAPWIELYNGGADDVVLDGLRLADNADLLSSWPLPVEESLAPGAFLVVFADLEPLEGVHHATFLLSASDEVVVLADRCGNVFDLLPLAGGATDVSVGDVVDGDPSAQGALPAPTPNATNE